MVNLQLLAVAAFSPRLRVAALAASSWLVILTFSLSNRHRGGWNMVETMLIDLKALLVEREDCDAGTVQRLRDGLAQGKSQYRTLRDVNDVLKKKVESQSGAAAKKLHLKLGVVNFFLGHLGEAAEHLKQAEGALAAFYLGKAHLERSELDEAFKAFERAEKSGYTAAQVQLQKAGIHRQRGELKEAKTILHKLEDQASHNAEYHYQVASLHLG